MRFYVLISLALVIGIALGGLGWGLFHGDRVMKSEAAPAGRLAQTQLSNAGYLEEFREILEGEIRARMALADRVRRLEERRSRAGARAQARVTAPSAVARPRDPPSSVDTFSAAY